MGDGGATQRESLEALLEEARLFRPTAEFSENANAGDAGIFARAANDLEGFWAEAAKRLDWIEPWKKVLEWDVPWAKWFVGGKLNASVNCLDRHVRNATRNKVALLWEGEPGEVRRISYRELHAEVQRFANVLKGLGIRKGDRVAV